MILDIDKNLLTPSMPAIYNLEIAVNMFLNFITPIAETVQNSIYSLFTNRFPTPLNRELPIPLKYFETAEKQNIYLHLLVVHGRYITKEEFFSKLSDSVDIKNSIESFLKIEPVKTLETIQKIVTVSSVSSNMELFFSSSMTLMPLISNNKNTVLIKYAAQNNDKDKHEDKINFIQAHLNFDCECNTMTLDCSRFNNKVMICRDIAILDAPYEFGEIMDMIEQEKCLHVIHKKRDNIELKTFLMENSSQTDDQSEDKVNEQVADILNSFTYRDTGNRLLTMNILSGTRGERSVLYNNILLKPIIGRSYSKLLDNFPGKIYDIVKVKENFFYILVWNPENRRGGIAPVINDNFGMDKPEWLWFDCDEQPRSLAFYEDLNVFFISIQGKGLIFIMENLRGSKLRDISYLFMDNGTELAAKGEILDLAMGNFILPVKNSTQSLSQSFLMVGQQTAITLFYFKENTF